MAHAHAQSLFLAVKPVLFISYTLELSMDEKEAEARPVMGTIFLVIVLIRAWYSCCDTITIYTW